MMILDQNVNLILNPYDSANSVLWSFSFFFFSKFLPCELKLRLFLVVTNLIKSFLRRHFIYSASNCPLVSELSLGGHHRVRQPLHWEKPFGELAEQRVPLFLSGCSAGGGGAEDRALPACAVSITSTVWQLV